MHPRVHWALGTPRTAIARRLSKISPTQFLEWLPGITTALLGMQVKATSSHGGEACPPLSTALCSGIYTSSICHKDLYCGMPLYDSFLQAQCREAAGQINAGHRAPQRGRRPKQGP